MSRTSRLWYDNTGRTATGTDVNDDQHISPEDNLSPSEPPLPRSPVRPRRPDDTQPKAPTLPSSVAPESPTSSSPSAALEKLRAKMEQVASEYAQGKINRSQFNAMYGRYSEQRAIIERLIERNPDSKAWQQVIGTGGHTGFLRQHFEAQPQYYVVYRHDSTAPLIFGGKQQPNIDELTPVLRQLWTMKNRPKLGLARKQMGQSRWLVLALGEYAVTLVMFVLEPSLNQAQLVRDMHADFERANRASLERGTARLDRMVFPQRALVEGNF